MEAKDLVVKPDLTLLDQNVELDGEMAWAIARYIEDAAEDVRLAKGKFWNVCKHGTRAKIASHYNWNDRTTEEYAMYAREIPGFPGISYTQWYKLKDNGVSVKDRPDWLKKVSDNKWTTKQIGKELDKARTEAVDKIIETKKKQKKEVEQKHQKPYEQTRTPFVAPKKPAITLMEACEFFGLSELSWITERSLTILYRGLAKEYHTDKGGGNGDMVKLNACHEILKKIIRG